MKKQLISPILLFMVFAVKLIYGDLHTINKREIFNVNQNTLKLSKFLLQ